MIICEHNETLAKQSWRNAFSFDSKTFFHWYQAAWDDLHLLARLQISFAQENKTQLLTTSSDLSGRMQGYRSILKTMYGSRIVGK